MNRIFELFNPPVAFESVAWQSGEKWNHSSAVQYDNGDGSVEQHVPNWKDAARRWADIVMGKKGLKFFDLDNGPRVASEMAGKKLAMLDWEEYGVHLYDACKIFKQHVSRDVKLTTYGFTNATPTSVDINTLLTSKTQEARDYLKSLRPHLDVVDYPDFGYYLWRNPNDPNDDRDIPKQLLIMDRWIDFAELAYPGKPIAVTGWALLDGVEPHPPIPTVYLDEYARLLCRPIRETGGIVNLFGLDVTQVEFIAALKKYGGMN